MAKKIICGKNSVLDAIEKNIDIDILYLSKNVFIDTKIPKKILSNQELNEITPLNHQGYIAILSSFEYFDFSQIINKKPEIILALDHIEDPQNLGAIIRSASAFNIKHIIIPDRRAASINTTVSKVASGGLNNVNISKVKSLSSSILKLKNDGYWIYSSLIDEHANELNKASFNFPLVIIIGNESKGVSSTIKNLSDETIYINMDGETQSLNASVATGILLYKIIEKKGQKTNDKFSEKNT
ncbi:MAG: 23S rRNA (guanosine(2251)-2'-O)-methyltransferase RlmB [Metamycoplasmataceae bacterium]